MIISSILQATGTAVQSLNYVFTVIFLHQCFLRINMICEFTDHRVVAVAFPKLV